MRIADVDTGVDSGNLHLAGDWRQSRGPNRKGRRERQGNKETPNHPMSTSSTTDDGAAESLIQILRVSALLREISSHFPVTRRLRQRR